LVPLQFGEDLALLFGLGLIVLAGDHYFLPLHLDGRDFLGLSEDTHIFSPGLVVVVEVSA